MLCGPDISMSYNVITSKHDSERITEAETLFEGQQCFIETINLGEGKTENAKHLT